MLITSFFVELYKQLSVIDNQITRNDTIFLY